MLLSHLDYLKHILDETNFVLKYASEKSKEQILNDEVLIKAIVRSVEIIGEATKKVPPEVTSKYPEVPWKFMAGTRDFLIHHYFGIDYDVMWNIISEQLPELKFQIENIIIVESNQ